MDEYKVKGSNRDKRLAAQRNAQPLDNRRSIQNIMRSISKRADQPVKR